MMRSNASKEVQPPPDIHSALLMIRDYACRNAMTPQAVCDTFSAGIIAIRVNGPLESEQ